MTTGRLLWNFLCRNVVIVTIIWGIYGGIFGTVIYPIVGTINIAVYVGFAGVPLGLINGLVSTIFTYYFSSNNEEYPYHLGVIGFLICVLYIGLPLLLINGGDTILAMSFLALTMLIPPMSMGLISYSIARWYQKQAREGLNNKNIHQSATLGIQESELVSKIKPQYSDIICNKNIEYIEIIISTPGLGFAILGLLSFVTPFILINMFKSIPLFTGIEQYGIAGIATPPIVIVFTFLILFTTFNYFGKIRLRIDRSQISLKKELFGLQKNILPPSCSTAIQSIHKFSTAYRKDVDGNIIRKSSRVEIVATSQKYFLSSGHKLSLREIDWIAAEISDWLNLPIDNN